MSDDERRPRFTAGTPVRIAGPEDRFGVGLDLWVDGTMGFHRTGTSTMVVAPNGPRLARHDLSSGGFLRGLVTADQAIEGLPADVRHASGGPLYHDPESGTLLLVYHGETFHQGDPRDFYSFLGMAVSRDGGRSFHDLGRVVASDLAERDLDRPRPVEVGSGGFVVRDGWFNLYFQDRNAVSVRRDLCVARARIDEVLDAAKRCRTPQFWKYWNGSFDEPGLGGRATELLPNLVHRVCWFDVAFLAAIDRSLLVHSTIQTVEGGVPMWNLATCTSDDGLHWSRPQMLFDEPVAAETLYVTIDSGGPSQRTIISDRFDVYRVRSTARFRWDDAVLERIPVAWSATG